MKKLQILVLASLTLFAFSCATEEGKGTNKKQDSTAKKTVETEKNKIEVKKEEISGYKIGDIATDFNLMNVDSTMISLSQYTEAKGFIVIFTCNHCPFSIAYEDRINALDEWFAPLGYPVIAINPNDPEMNTDDSFDNKITRAQEKNFTFPYLFDQGQKIYPQYGATKTPHVYVLNKEGEQNIVRYIGAIDNNHEDANDVTEKYLENAVNSLLAGEAIVTETTVAIGCGIKTKK